MSTFIARLAATSIVAALSLGLVGQMGTPEPELPAQPVAEAPPPEPEPPRFADVKHTIARGETLGTILNRYGVTAISSVVDVASPHADLTRIRADRTLTFRYDRDIPRPIALRYPLDEDRTLVVHLDGEGPRAELEQVEYESRLGVRDLELTSSLWAAAIDAGLRPGDIVAIARVFQWQLDFNTELRAGARFKVVADELYLDDSYAKAGTLHAVKLVNGGKTYTAVRYVDSDGREGWYHPDGTANKRQFLRSPLEFSRVTSGFTRKRYHPVLKRNRAHLGTDLGAATGTPIRAVGDGVVRIASTRGGYGKHVRLDHAGPYESSYSHLSKISVRKGQKIKQGDIIGRVGSTGLATGPHLHYEFKVSGKHVDPMKVKLPQSEPLSRTELAAFAETRDHWLPMLEEGVVPLSIGAGGDALVDND